MNNIAATPPKSSVVRKIFKFLLTTLVLYIIVCILNTLLCAYLIAFNPVVFLNDSLLIYGASALLGIVFGILRHRKHLTFNPSCLREKRKSALIWTLIVLPTGFLAASLFSETHLANDLFSLISHFPDLTEKIVQQASFLSDLTNRTFYLVWILSNSFIWYNMLVMYGTYWLVKNVFSKA